MKDEAFLEFSCSGLQLAGLQVLQDRLSKWIVTPFPFLPINRTGRVQTSFYEEI